MESLRETLKTQGYAVIENVLNEAQIAEATGYFRKWISSNPQITKNHRQIDPNGIFKFSEVGHQRFVAAIELMRSTARGEHNAIQVPPSEPKPFCGEK